MLHELILSFSSCQISHSSLFWSFLMGFTDHYIQHFFYRQDLDPDLAPSGSYCPLPFNPDFGH